MCHVMHKWCICPLPMYYIHFLVPNFPLEYILLNMNISKERGQANVLQNAHLP